MAHQRLQQVTFLVALSVFAFRPTMTMAQAAPTGNVTVKVASPIFLYPDEKRQPLVVAKAGSVVRVLGEDGDFYNIEFRDPALGPRVGFIRKGNVTAPVPDYSRVPSVDVSVDAAPQSTTNQPSTPARVEPPPVSSRPDSRPVSIARREGFWFNVGGGYGTLGCQDCGSRISGASGGLSLGTSITPRVLFGVGTTGWYRSEFGDTLTMGTLDARFRFYPSATNGFFITLGLGLGHLSLNNFTEWGTGAVVGIGGDIRVGRKVSLTPFWNGFAMQSSSMDANVGQIGLGITIQ